MAKIKLGELLVNAGVLNESQLTRGLEEQKRWGKRLGTTLVELGLLDEDTLRKALSKQLQLPSVDFKKVDEIDSPVLDKIPLEIAEKFHVIPLAIRSDRGRDVLHLAMADPTNFDAINDIEFRTGYSVKVYVATISAIDRAISKFYKGVIYGDDEPVHHEDNTQSEMVLVRGVVEQTMQGQGQRPESYELHEEHVSSKGRALEGSGLPPALRALLELMIKKGLITADEYYKEFEKHS